MTFFLTNQSLISRFFLPVLILLHSHWSVAGVCDWLDEEVVRLLEEDLLPKLRSALTRAQQGKTKQEWVAHLKSLLATMESQVPGQTTIAEDSEFKRVLGDKVIGSVSLLSPMFDRSRQFAARLHGETDKEYQGRGVFKLLVLEAIARQPNIGVIATTLSGTNSEIIHDKLQQGLPLEEAVKHTPAWKTRESLGFTEILYLRATFGTGPLRRFEFIVGRNPSIVEAPQ